jgi:hypothetical protein
MTLWERRTRVRGPEPPCIRCNTLAASVVLRSPHVLYYRCAVCGEVWSVPKPTHPAVDIAARFRTD